MDEPRLKLPLFNTIDVAEKFNISRALKAPLSGYLGGINKAGYFVTQLQDKWREAFGVKHAIACNSATSGLLAACMAIGIGPGDVVWTTAYSMSATAACAKVLGATIVFIDIEKIRFSLNLEARPRTGAMPKCLIVTNLFGHPAYLSHIRSWCDSNKVIMIEDAAQSPFAMEDGKYAGTIGNIGVFSFNVHKHLQSGEGGIIVTNNSEYWYRLQGAINHGELSNEAVPEMAGLNLRMTETTAAIACVQLAKAPKIIPNRIELAETLTDMVKDIPWIKPPKADKGCKHVYYIWAALAEEDKRLGFTDQLELCGFPMQAGYSRPLHQLFHLPKCPPDGSPTRDLTPLPVVEYIEYNEIITFEICRWNPTIRNLSRMREIIKGAVDDL